MLRRVIDKLQQVDSMMECDHLVDRDFELGAVSTYFENKVPILFNNIKETDVRTIAGLYGNRELFYYMMDMQHQERFERIANAIANPQPYKVLPDGPVHENVISGTNKIIDLNQVIPLNHFNEKDSGKYITAGVLVVRDLETGKIHTSVRRFQYNGKNNLSALIASPHLQGQIQELAKQGKNMDVAIVLGYDAEYLLASQISSQYYGLDKNELDSALRGEPLELVKCKTNDLLVPADAEIVLEGKLISDGQIDEGPFGELMGYYGSVRPNPYVEVEVVTHRNNPIYQTAFPCREEHFSNGIVREVELYYHMRNTLDVVDVNITEGGGYRLDAFVAIRKKSAGDGKTAILSALGLNKDLKNLVIVDHDVDIFDLKDIEWAISSRTQAKEDFVIVGSALGSGLEASHLLRGVSDKVGIDATAPLGMLENDFERAIIPGYEQIDISKYFPELETK